MKRFASFFVLICFVAVAAVAQTAGSDAMLMARKSFIQGNYALAREYALRAKAQGNEEAANMIGQIDYKVLAEQVEKGTATESAFNYFKTKYKGTAFASQADHLYDEWRGEAPTYVPQAPREGAGSLHFDRRAYEEQHFGPMWRVGLSGDIGFGCNATYGGGVSFLLGRTNCPVNLLLGMEMNVLGHFSLHYDEYYDEYYHDDEPYLRARRLTIPIELQFNLTHNDRRQRSYLGIGIDYNRNFYGKLIDNRGDIDYSDVIKKHTCDFRLSLGYSWRHCDVFGFMKVIINNPFDNDLVYWEGEDPTLYPDRNLDTYCNNIYNQLHRRCSGGFGVRVWL